MTLSHFHQTWFSVAYDKVLCCFILVCLDYCVLVPFQTTGRLQQNKRKKKVFHKLLKSCHVGLKKVLSSAFSLIISAVLQLS